MEKFNKISGIYQIRNKINGKRYIGKSNNITLRWSSHISDLVANKHKNNKLQEDFNTYNATAFEFTILELVTDLTILSNLEQTYINTLDLSFDYNKHNATLSNEINNTDKFIKYINDRWLLPNYLKENPPEKYKIYKREDKKRILEKAIEYRIINDFPSRITYNEVVTFMIKKLGYTFIVGRVHTKQKHYRYKLITNYDNKEIDDNV